MPPLNAKYKIDLTTMCVPDIEFSVIKISRCPGSHADKYYYSIIWLLSLLLLRLRATQTVGYRNPGKGRSICPPPSGW